MCRLTWDGAAAEPVSRDQILRRERGQGNIIFPCSADHEQDWQPYPVDPYSCYMCGHTYILGVRINPARVWKTSGLKRHGTTEPVPRGQVLRCDGDRENMFSLIITSKFGGLRSASDAFNMPSAYQ